MESIWLKSYPPGVVSSVDPDVYPSLVHALEGSVHRYAELPCVTNLGQTLTFKETWSLSGDFASFLQQGLGLAKGTRVALMLPNVLQYVVCFLGALRAGMIVVPVNPLYTAEELAHQLKDSGSAVLVCLANFAKVVEDALPRVSVQHVIITEVGDLLPIWKKYAVNWVVRYVKGFQSYSIPSAWTFDQAMRVGRERPVLPVELNSHDIALLQYTGGTTGVSKGAILTHRNIISNVLQCTAWVRPWTTSGEEIIITPLPLYHIFSLTVNFLTFFYVGGHNVLVTNPRDIDDLLKVMCRWPFTAMTGVNTLFNALLNHPDFVKCRFEHMRLCIAGGMALQRKVAEQWRRLTGTQLLEGYGLTEASPCVCMNPLNADEHSGTIGLPLPSTFVSIRNEEGEELPLGEVGELCVKGPQVMVGYWQRPDETKKSFFAEGWLRTGDLATLDKTGYVRVVDRKKDLIIVSGFNVYPNEIEDALATHPGIREVAVIGVPDERTGEAVKAFIVKSDPTLDPEQIIAFCRNKLTNYKIPKRIVFCEQLPKSNVGKILRKALRE